MCLSDRLSCFVEYIKTHGAPVANGNEAAKPHNLTGRTGNILSNGSNVDAGNLENDAPAANREDDFCDAAALLFGNDDDDY